MRNNSNDQRTNPHQHRAVQEWAFHCQMVFVIPKRHIPKLFRFENIQTAIAFLSTRVKEPNMDNMKKLTRVIKYLNASIDIVLRLSAKASLMIKWWIDGSFAVHQDMRSHTGGTMSMGHGSIFPNSTKQKFNTRSSTEAELVAVDKVLQV
jgi:hypothetical protein